MTPAELPAWRKSERARLLRERQALGEDLLGEWRMRIDSHIQRAFPDLVHGTVAFCWPYKNEYDARHLLAEGPLGIPYPEASPEVRPDHVLLPMLGWDAQGYRLGYGGGFFDRTLAAFEKRPRVIGVSYEPAHLQTIYPQPYDIPVDFVVTERGAYQREPEGLKFLDNPQSFSSPPCYAGEIAPDYFGEGTER